MSRQSTGDLQRLRAEYSRRESQPFPSGRYTFFEVAHLFSIQNRQRVLLNLLEKANYRHLQGLRMLDLGCGRGGDLLGLLHLGTEAHNLFGTDLLFHRLRDGRSRSPFLAFSCADGQNMPYGPNTFDVIFQNTVFSSILDEQIKKNLAREMMRILKPGGLIIWYDFWLNPTNEQTKGIRRAEIYRLFPQSQIVFRRITLAPPITRLLIRYSWLICQLLEKVSIFNTHYLAAIQPERFQP